MPRPQSSADVTPVGDSRPPLPKGWGWVGFGDVVTNVNTTEKNPLQAGFDRFVGLEHLEPHDLRVRTWGSVADGTTFNRVFRSGQVLFGKRRAYQRKAALADFDGICSGDIYVFAANERHLIPELLPFLVQSEGFALHAENTSEGSLSPRTKWKYLAKYEFALPLDAAEQRRIAELLRAADAAVEAWREVRESLFATRESRMNFWFDATRPETDAGWKLVRLDEVASLQTGLALGKDYVGKETECCPYLRVANVQDGHLDLSVMKTVIIPKADAGRYLVKVGDVLMNEGGDFDKLGRGAVWYGEIEGCLHQNHVFCIRPEVDQLSSEFLAIQAQSVHGKRYFLKCVKKTTNLASINSAQVRKFPLLITTMVEQVSVVAEFDLLASAIRQVCERLNHTHGLNKQLATQLLTPPPESP